MHIQISFNGEFSLVRNIFTFICSLFLVIDGVGEGRSSIGDPTVNLDINTDIRDISGGSGRSDVTSVTADWSVSQRGRGGRSEGGVRAVVMEMVV